MIQTEIIPPSEIQRAIFLLKAGKPVAFPTETVYGLGALLFSEEAVARVFAIKERPADNPLIVHIASLSQLSSLCQEIPAQAELLCQRFWPGPLTLVLKQNGTIPPLVSAGHPTVAIRMPSHPIALALIEGVGEPLVAPSANLSGRPSPTRAEDVFEDLRGRVELILDGGECPIGIESTVVSLVGEKPLLLRPGHISQEEIEEVLQQKLATSTAKTPIHSPGMKYRHYAPKARVRLAADRCEIKGPFVLSTDPQPGERLLSRNTLYAAFREADRLGVTEIYIECTPALYRDAALMNRLLRAAAF